ncbi:MAG TPA: zinc-ribbon domain-containing protein, partial [Desulfobacterales bacterium]
MKITCKKCKATYTIDASKLPDSEIKIPCKKCGQPIKINKEGTAHYNTEVKVDSKESKKSSHISYKDLLFSKLISGIDIHSLNKRKLSVCAILFLLILTIQINPIRNVFFENHLFSSIDRGAEAVIDENMKRATISFAVARSINGV